MGLPIWRSPPPKAQKVASKTDLPAQSRSSIRRSLRRTEGRRRLIPSRYPHHGRENNQPRSLYMSFGPEHHHDRLTNALIPPLPPVPESRNYTRSLSNHPNRFAEFFNPRTNLTSSDTRDEGDTRSSNTPEYSTGPQRFVLPRSLEPLVDWEFFVSRGVDGLGDRETSLSPNLAATSRDDNWDTMLNTIAPDTALPTADSSFTSVAASASFSAPNRARDSASPSSASSASSLFSSQHNSSSSTESSRTRINVSPTSRHNPANRPRREAFGIPNVGDEHPVHSPVCVFDFSDTEDDDCDMPPTNGFVSFLLGDSLRHPVG